MYEFNLKSKDIIMIAKQIQLMTPYYTVTSYIPSIE